MDLSSEDYRRDCYFKRGLKREDSNEDPFKHFGQWTAQMIQHKNSRSSCHERSESG